MPSMNKAIIIGHLGRDPEIKDLASGKQICNLSVATSEGYKDKSGEWQDKTEWHKVTLMTEHACKVASKAHKGSLVMVEGKIQTRKWQDKDGADRYSTEIVVAPYSGNIMLLDKQDKGDAGDGWDNAAAPAPGQIDDQIPF